MALSSLGPGEYLEAFGSVARVLDSHATALDALHHDPATDGSPAPRKGPGADLAATLDGAVQAARGARDFASLSTSMVEGARRACAGRAGRQAVTVLDGMGEVLRNVDRLDGPRLALALESAAERFAPADTGADPGGFAAVLTEVADAALSAADAGAELGEVLLQAADGGLEELERGPETNQRLAAKGAVDAAAAGFLLMLDTLASVVTGEPLPSPPGDGSARAAGTAGRSAAGGDLRRYHVGCRLRPFDGGIESLAHLEAALHELAARTLVVTGEAEWVVAVDTALPGAAVEVLVAHGAPREVDVHLIEADSPTDGLERRAGTGATTAS